MTLSDPAERTRVAIYASFASTGTLPPPEALARRGVMPQFKGWGTE